MKKLVIMMYHRIVQRKIEFKKSPFNLTEKEFEEQIDYLEKNFSIIDYSEFKEIIAKVFNIKAEEVNEDLSKDDIGSWDSLKQMDMIFSLEEKYSLQFEIEEIASMNSIKEIMRILSKKGIDL